MSNFYVKKSNKKKFTSKHLSSLEIKKYLAFQKITEKSKLNIGHLQSFYRFCDEKNEAILQSFDENPPEADLYFVKDTLHFAILNVMNDLSIMLFNNIHKDLTYKILLLESLKYSFPKDSDDFLDMSDDIQKYGKHLHSSILSYFQQ